MNVSFRNDAKQVVFQCDSEKEYNLAKAYCQYMNEDPSKKQDSALWGEILGNRL